MGERPKGMYALRRRRSRKGEKRSKAVIKGKLHTLAQGPLQELAKVSSTMD